MMIQKRLAALALATMALTASGRAANIEAAKDWPQFHGPNRDNISRETGLLKEWKGSPPLAWSIGGVGDGYSSVSVANGKIFTAGDVGDSCFVVALNEADGKELWKSKLGPSGQHGGYVGPRATPTVDGGLLYMLGQNGELACYQAADGKEVWRTSLGGQMMSGWGNSESVVVDGDLVIYSPGGKEGTLAALNKKTGQPVWRTKDFTDKSAYMAPVIATIEGVRQAVALTDKSVAGIAVADGKLLWRHDRPGSTAVIPTPVVKDNFVFVTSGYHVGCDLFKVTANDGKFNVERVYGANKNMVNHHGGVILLDNALYGYSDGPDKEHGDQKAWRCLDFMTGEVKWEDKKLLGKGSISYADGRFYLRDEGKGTIVLLEADATHHVERGRFEQPQRSKKNAWPHLVIANGHLYVRDQNSLLCYDVRAK